MTWGTAGDSKGANNSHGDLVKETCTGSYFSHTSSEVCYWGSGEAGNFLFWPISHFLDHFKRAQFKRCKKVFPAAPIGQAS